MEQDKYFDDNLNFFAEQNSENAHVKENTNKELHTKKKKPKKSKIKALIVTALSLAIVFALAFGAFYCVADYSGIAFGRGQERKLNIEQGDSVDVIAEKLQDTGAVKIPFLFKLYCKITGVDGQLKYGFHKFNTDLGYKGIADMLVTQGAMAETIKVTIPEGTGINDYTKDVEHEKITVPGIATLLEKKGVCKKSDFIEALSKVELDSRLLKCANKTDTYYTLEGYLFPETYEFYKTDDSKKAAESAVKTLIEEANKRITDEMYQKADKIGLSMNEVLTLASIVQMEAGNNTKEMPNVAAVFLNRLRSPNFKTLGSSPTCYYGESFKKDDGRYNTYYIKDLPPGPLCSPGISAINAVLNATKNLPYYYFVTDKNGKFYFHKTLAEQNKTINSLKQGNNWINEYFD